MNYELQETRLKRLLVHTLEELGVGFGFLEPFEQKLHGLDGVELAQYPAQGRNIRVELRVERGHNRL